MMGHHTVLIVAALLLSAGATTANAQTVVIDSPVVIVDSVDVCVPELAVPVQMVPLVQVMPMVMLDVPAPHIVLPSQSHPSRHANGPHSVRHDEAQIVLFCPEDAIVLINGEPTKSTGMQRIFTSAMPGHSKRLYQITAKIMRPNSYGTFVEKQIVRDVVLSPGQEKTVVLASTEFWERRPPGITTTKTVEGPPPPVPAVPVADPEFAGPAAAETAGAPNPDPGDADTANPIPVPADETSASRPGENADGTENP